MQICDGREQCDFVSENRYAAVTGAICSLVEVCRAVSLTALIGSFSPLISFPTQFFKLDPDKTSYLSTTRCGNGTTGELVTSITDGTYLKCLNTYDHPVPLATFQLPPFLCQQSCDKDLRCNMYSVDAAGQSCWLAMFGGSSDYTNYIKVIRVLGSNPSLASDLDTPSAPSVVASSSEASQ